MQDSAAPAMSDEEVCHMTLEERRMSVRVYTKASQSNEKYRAHLRFIEGGKRTVEEEMADAMTVLRQYRERVLPMRNVVSAEYALMVVAERIISMCHDLHERSADIDVSELNDSQAVELASRIHRETGLIAVFGYGVPDRPRSFSRCLPPPGGIRMIRIGIHTRKGQSDMSHRISLRRPTS
jgi:hypothetical protein